MDKLNMINYQRLVLQEKFGKSNQTKKTIKNILKILLSMFLIGVFCSLLFLNTESQVLTQQFLPGFLNMGDLSHG